MVQAAPQVETVSDAEGRIVVECYKDGSRIRVRAISEGYDSSWHVQFPRAIREAGARYVVDQVHESPRGGFYRAYGNIRRFDG